MEPIPDRPRRRNVEFHESRIGCDDRVLFVGEGWAQPTSNEIVMAVSNRTRKVGFASALHEASKDILADHIMIRSPSELVGKWVKPEAREAVDASFCKPPAPTFVHLVVSRCVAFSGHFYVPPQQSMQE